MNRARTNIYMSHIDDTITPYCSHCGPPQIDSINHILLHCPKYYRIRHFCESSIFRSTGLLLSLDLLLGFVDHYPKNIREFILQYSAVFLQELLKLKNI